MDYAVVTIRIESFHWQKDMELPTKMSIKNLAPMILEMLKDYDPDLFDSVSSLLFFHDGKKLNEEASLADYNIWDGSILDMSVEKF